MVASPSERGRSPRPPWGYVMRSDVLKMNQAACEVRIKGLCQDFMDVPYSGSHYSVSEANRRTTIKRVAEKHKLLEMGQITLSPQKTRFRMDGEYSFTGRANTFHAPYGTSEEEEISQIQRKRVKASKSGKSP